MSAAVATVASSALSGGAAGWRKVRVGLTYWWRHGRWPSLDAPQLFTEWVQWRKLTDRSPALAMLTDKSCAKAFAANILGPDFVVPTLWSGRTLPSLPPAPLPLMVKANHGCGQYAVVRSARDWKAVRDVAGRWLDSTYGAWLDEWHYEAAERKLIVEPLLGDPARLPVDYKIYVFHGRARMVQVHEGRGTRHRWSQLDLDWRPLSRQETSLPAPVSLPSMVDAAERVAAGHDFLRVDFYEQDGKALFGECCLFPGSGLDPFDPPSLDAWLGDCWAGVR